MKKNFDLFMSQLTETNSTLDYFVDFSKVRSNVSKIELNLNVLNYLIGKKNIQSAIKDIFEENSKAFEVLDILIAVRKQQNKKAINTHLEIKLIKDYFKNPNSIYTFIKETGLEEVFMNKDIKNLVDYVFGIEVGLDTNARKNRGGVVMQNLISSTFEKNNIKYESEVYSSALKGLENLGKDLKRFDFVISTPNKIFLIEVNYYNAGGSKLNEVARSYTEIAAKINSHTLYEFVWITDGQGWHTAKSKLEEAYQSIDEVYNLKNLEDFIKKIKNL